MLSSLQAIPSRNISIRYVLTIIRIPLAFFLGFILLCFIPSQSLHADTIDYTSLMFTISGPLTVNGNSMGNIEIGIDEAQNIYIQYKELQSLLTELMKEDAAAQFLSSYGQLDEDKWISVDSLESSDYLSHEFSMADLSLSLTIAPEVRLTRNISITTPPYPPTGTRIEKLPASLFVNAAASSQFEIDRSASDPQFTLPLEALFSPTLNIGRSTFSTNIRLQEQNLLDGISRNLEDFIPSFSNTQYIYDFPEGAVLFQLGNISYNRHAFQTAGTQKGGVLKKDLSSQADAGSSRILSKSPKYDLLLEEDALVVITLNGKEVKREQLTAGNYIIRDFSLQEGINKIEISTLSGEDTAKESTSVYYEGFSRSVEPPGETSFVIGMGAPAWEDFDTPVIFMNHDISINKNSSAGYFFEISAEKQLFGVSGLIASKFGNLSADTAFSNSKTLPFGGALSLAYRLYPLSAAVRNSSVISGTFKSKYFTEFSRSIPDDSIFTASFSHNRSLFNQIGFSIQGAADIPRSFAWEDAEASLRMSANTSLFRQISLSGTLKAAWEGIDNTTPDITGSIYFSYRPKNSNISISANQTEESNAVRASWSPENDKGYTSAYQAQISNIEWNDPKPDRITVSDRIQHQFFDLRLQQQLLKDSQDIYDLKTDVELKSSLVWANGITAFSSPIQQGFVLIRPEAGFKDYPIIVDRSRFGVEISTKKTGTAVVPNITPFYSNRIKIRAMELEAGYNLNEDDFLFNPSYSGAGLITVGDEQPPVSLSGRFLTPDWQPLSFVSGTVHTFNGERIDTPKLMFTDDTGYFEIHNLQPGTFLFTLNHDIRRTYRITIPDGVEGQHDLGTLVYGGTPLVQPFPPLGSQIQLMILQRRLMEANMYNDDSYDIPKLIKRATNERALIPAADAISLQDQAPIRDSFAHSASKSFPSAVGKTSLTGRFMNQTGEPAKHIRGELTSFNEKTLSYPISFRTDGTGKFTLWGIAPGSYELKLSGKNNETEKWFELNIPEGFHGYYDIGNIEFSGENLIYLNSYNKCITKMW